MFTHAVPGSVRLSTAGVDRFAALVWRRVGKVNPPSPPVPHVGGYSRRDRGRGSCVKATLARRYTGCF